jgi:Family of unknown function (DUF5360)
MSRPLRYLLLFTDVAFLAYWLVAALHEARVLTLPPDWLYAHADDPRVKAWNWSFLPLDLAFSATGLAAVSAMRRGKPWRHLTIVSLVLTMVAGGMAVSYWTLTGEIDWSWYGANLFLLVWPLFFLPGLLREAAPA